MTPAIRQHDSLDLSKDRAALEQAKKAVKLLGAVVSPKIYEEVEGTWVNRLSLWFARGDCAVDDVGKACESLSTPEAMSRIVFASEFNAELAGAIVAFRTRRVERERQAKERADAVRWSVTEHAAMRETLDQLLAGVGKQVGTGRPQHTRGSTRDEGQDPTPDQVAQAEGETARQARAKKARR